MKISQYFDRFITKTEHCTLFYTSGTILYGDFSKSGVCELLQTHRHATTGESRDGKNHAWRSKKLGTIEPNYEPKNKVIFQVN